MDEARDGGAQEKTVETRAVRPVFEGSAGEYFRIWIVNVFLTVITLGLYAAWAKVRTRRYFYNATRLGGEPLEYLAAPTAILRGNLLVFGGFAVYAATEAFSPETAGVLVLVFYGALPYLLYKAMRFFAHNSAFRNVRLRFHGTLGESYRIYLGLPLLLAPTLGALFPYWEYRRKRYLLENLAYGRSPFYFGGGPGYFYRTYAVGTLLFLLLPAGAFAAAGIAAVTVAGSVQEPPPDVVGTILGLLPAAAVLPAWLLGKQYLDARLTNYSWNQTRIGSLRFESTLRARDLIWIRLTNVLAILLSFGLLAPWARVRRTRYQVGRLAVHAPGGLDDFRASSEPDQSALGDSAADFFDFEIGFGW